MTEYEESGDGPATSPCPQSTKDSASTNTFKKSMYFYTAYTDNNWKSPN